MKYVKMIGLLAVAAAALMAFAGPASAKLTSPSGTTYGGTIHATAGTTSLDGSIDVTCTSSTVTGTVSSGSTSGPVSSLSFSGCGKDTVTVLGSPSHGNAGTLAISGGSVFSSEAEVTVQLHRSVLGFPITTHCVYVTNNTNVGTFTGGSPAKLDIDSAQIPVDEEQSDGACGDTAEWTGSYTVNTPNPLFAD